MERKETVVSGLSFLLALFGSSSAQTTTASESESTAYAELFTTTILLPSALFSPTPVQQSFGALVSTISGTTFYSIGVDASNNLTAFAPALVTQYDWAGYPFSASAGKTQFVWQNLTVDCPSPSPPGTATCTTTSTNLDLTNSPSYHTLAESSFYSVAIINPNVTQPTPLMPPLLKVSIGLGAPLALCVCVLVIIFIRGHRVHKQQSRLKHARVVTMGDEDMKGEPLVPMGEGGATSFKALGGGEEVGGGHGVAVSEASVFTNELDGEGKTGRKELA